MMEQAKRYVIAVDIGTTSTKALVVDEHGAIKGHHSIGYNLSSPLPDRAEQNPNDIYEAVIESVHLALVSSAVSSDAVVCVSFSSAMHSLIAVDEGFNPLTEMITWADNRSIEQANQLKSGSQGMGIYLRTGTPLHPMSPLTKLMWLKANEPELFTKAAWFVGIKEYIFAKLFGRVVVDYSLASATGLFNLTALQWDEEALRIAGVTADRLPEPVPPTYRLGGLNLREAERMGLQANTPFIVGASDGTLANLGAGAFEPGVFAVTIGTSGAVRAVVKRPITDPRGRLFCYALTEDAWVVGGAVNNGGIMLRWVRDVLATQEAAEAREKGIEPYSYLIDLAAQIPPGSGGLIMLPMLTGERAPHWNANARGVFVGLSLAHQKSHMIRAVLEGVLFGLQSVNQVLAELVGPGQEIRASGGFARSVIWRQMMADIMGMPLVVPEAIESSGLGAAYLGFMAMQLKHDFSGIHEWVKAGSQHNVNRDDYNIYQRIFPLYDKVYNGLKATFDDIADLQNRGI
jgi:gluconokinase